MQLQSGLTLWEKVWLLIAGLPAAFVLFLAFFSHWTLSIFFGSLILWFLNKQPYKITLKDECIQANFVFKQLEFKYSEVKCIYNSKSPLSSTTLIIEIRKPTRKLAFGLGKHTFDDVAEFMNEKGVRVLNSS